MSQHEDHWTDEEKTERARRFLVEEEGFRNLSIDYKWFAYAIEWASSRNSKTPPTSVVNPKYCAFKRACRIHASKFWDEPYLKPGYFGDDTPDYPKQWLEHMSEGAAEDLYQFIDEPGTLASIDKELFEKGFIQFFPNSCTMTPDYVLNRPVFTTGGLELPDCIDKSDLN